MKWLINRRAFTRLELLVVTILGFRPALPLLALSGARVNPVTLERLVVGRSLPSLFL
jgi:hypothetical protein